MPTLRDQLLQAGLVTAEQAEKAEDGASPKKSRRSRRGGRGRAKSLADGSPGPIDERDDKRLTLLRAIEEHRLREAHDGEIAFNFTTRGDIKIRKLFVNIRTAARLGAGELAIVETGGTEREHVIVTKEAVAAIRAVDPDAIRFHTGT